MPAGAAAVDGSFFDVDTCLQRKLDAWPKRVVVDEKTYGYPQMQTLVAYKDKIVYEGSTGERRPPGTSGTSSGDTSGVPLGNDTIFRIYSMTKPVAVWR